MHPFYPLKERMEIMDQKGINQWWNEQMMSDYFEQVFDQMEGKNTVNNTGNDDMQD